YKARLVAKGCSQKYHVDYEEIYSPVVRHSSVRFLLALAIKNSWDVDHMDVETAFLHANPEEQIYMQLPDDPYLGGQICKLNKSVYGLKQSNRNWNMTLTSYLKELEFEQSNFDPCIFYLHADHGTLIVSLYVDDLLIVSSNNQVKI